MEHETLKRLLARVLAPLLDVAVFCALIHQGLSLRASHIASFAAAMALNYLLKVRSTPGVAGRATELGLHCRLFIVSLMALFLRGGVLSLLSLSWGWAPQVSIWFTVLAGLAVLIPGYAAVLSRAEGSARWRALAAGLIAYGVALRLVYLRSVELLPEEAYYWNYSRHLDIGYLDHPPMVAWLIRLGTAMFGQSEFGVRVGAVCCAAIASAFTYRLTRNLFGEASALAALLLAQALPYFFLSGLLMTPDAPLVAAWAASLYYLERALVAGLPNAWWRVGLALGIGGLSKYSIGLLVPVTILFMLWDPRARRQWRRWQPYAAALLALAVFSPVIIWNAQHDWASFAFQTSRRLAEAPRFALHKLVASTLILITPTGVLAVGAAFTTAKPDANIPGDARRRWLFLGIAIWVPLTVFAIFSLRHEVKLDWTGASWVAALPLMAAGMTATATRVRGLAAVLQAAWLPTVVTLLLLYGAGLHYLVLGLPGLGYGAHIELVPVAWRELSRRIADAASAIHRETGNEPLLVGMDRYAIASELAFYGAQRSSAALDTSSAHLFGGIGLMYQRWTPSESQLGRNLLLVAWSEREISGAAIESHAQRLGPVEDEVLTRDGKVVRHYFQRVAYNYRLISSEVAQ
jgi:dolichol-phosphate mannosyltransferase